MKAKERCTYPLISGINKGQDCKRVATWYVEALSGFPRMAYCDVHVKRAFGRIKRIVGP